MDEKGETSQKEWIQTQVKKLKQAKVVKPMSMFLNAFPFTLERQTRVETALFQLVMSETDTLSPTEFKQFQRDLAMVVGDRPLRVESFGDNLAWMGTYTWGCSFGRRVLCVWNKAHDPPSFDQLKCTTPDAFHQLMETQKDYDLHVTDGMKELETLLWNRLEEEAAERQAGPKEEIEENPWTGRGREVWIPLIMEELIRVEKYMHMYNCACVQPKDVVDVV